jgi:hypothetical protein
MRSPRDLLLRLRHWHVPTRIIPRVETVTTVLVSRGMLRTLKCSCAGALAKRIDGFDKIKQNRNDVMHIMMDLMKAVFELLGNKGS